MRMTLALAALTAAMATADAAEAAPEAPAPAPAPATAANPATPAPAEAPATAAAPATPEAAMQKTLQFLKDAGVYYIATVEGDQPRVRPFGTALIFEGRLYIQTGRKKNVAKQMLANGKVELCAMKGKEWIRVSGELVDDPRTEPQAAMLDAHPSLKKMYAPGDGNNMVLYFKPGTVTATISTFGREPEVLRF